ncbi:MAG: hypothetical protein JO347_11495 [Candidatus Eremiobacteraeota bacterium]|nr:hypothetical protein [Candidatus Eremiobacteraeota bacterium]
MNRTILQQAGSSAQQAVRHVMAWPPLVYVLLGIGLLFIWALGTSAQVLTSEAWMNNQPLDQINYSAWAQLWMAVTGHLPPGMLVPFMFGWGVQFALIVASIGVELPPYPRWRKWLALICVAGLVCINSCGDFVSSAQYGIWGQLGFLSSVFFVTFCVLLFAIMSFKHAFSLMEK